MESQMVQNSPGFHRRVIIKTPFSQRRKALNKRR